MNRRTLLKVLGLFPLIGPALAKALAKFDLKPPLRSGPYLPAFFPQWDKAVDGLEEAGKWAIEIERARLPSDMQVPRVGQIWETVRDCEVPFRPCFAQDQSPDGWARTKHFAALPWKLMFGGEAEVRQGERIRVIGVDNPIKPLEVRFQPLRYDELQAGIVPEEVRCAPGYVGYEFSTKTAKTLPDFGKGPCGTYFNEAFRLVADAV